MKERFLLDRITLQRGDISMRNAQFATLIEPHLTNPPLALTYHTTMSTGKTTYRPIFQLFIQPPLNWSDYPVHRLSNSFTTFRYCPILSNGTHVLFCQTSICITGWISHNVPRVKPNWSGCSGSKNTHPLIRTRSWLVMIGFNFVSVH